VLNYGHTFAHAFETLTGYEQLLHGEAVAIGMVCAARLAERIGRLDARCTQRQHRLLEALGLPTRLPKLDREAALRTMLRDKKARQGRLRFVLPRRIGEVEVVADVPEEQVRAVLKECGE
jgi:3-dehydroquinate synthase